MLCRQARTQRSVPLWQWAEVQEVLVRREQKEQLFLVLSGAAPKMGEGLPRSAYRRRSQTTQCCCSSKGYGSERLGKVLPRGGKVSVEKVSESKLSEDASKLY